ncbi:MAG: lipoate--protein ligase [Clostridiales bacterium]|nr:lipoate--protein ligase [Clostridiales bacterium]MDR2712323.1 lipoate--protein ligase [Clostridiales bacterium]
MAAKIYISTCHDVWDNQAFEEYLLEGEEMPALLLWQNALAVVIGRHQNAWKEADWQSLEQEGGQLARRLSGGGAVYHDLGNLNFTFFVAKKEYDLPRQVGIILKAVRALGVNAAFAGRNDLEVNGRKFSGNAFCFRRERAFHHGTLLVNSDMGAMDRYLQVSLEKITNKGVDSLPARVINLEEISSKVNVSSLVEAICDSFCSYYPGAFPEKVDTSQAAPVFLKEKYASWDWRFGSSPEFGVRLSRRFSWGNLDLTCVNHLGLIERAHIYSDILNADLVDILTDALIQQPFKSLAIRSAWQEAARRHPDLSGNDQKIIEDLLSWIAEAKF